VLFPLKGFLFFFYILRAGVNLIYFIALMTKAFSVRNTNYEAPHYVRTDIHSNTYISKLILSRTIDNV